MRPWEKIGESGPALEGLRAENGAARTLRHPAMAAELTIDTMANPREVCGPYPSRAVPRVPDHFAILCRSRDTGEGYSGTDRRGSKIANLVVTSLGFKTVEVPLVARADVAQVGVFRRSGLATSYTDWGAGR